MKLSIAVACLSAVAFGNAPSQSCTKDSECESKNGQTFVCEGVELGCQPKYYYDEGMVCGNKNVENTKKCDPKKLKCEFGSDGKGHCEKPSEKCVKKDKECGNTGTEGKDEKCCDDLECQVAKESEGLMGAKKTCQKPAKKCVKKDKECGNTGTEGKDEKCCDDLKCQVAKESEGLMGAKKTCQKKTKPTTTTTTTTTTTSTKTKTTTTTPTPTCTDTVGMMGPVDMSANGVCAQKVNGSIVFNGNCSEAKFYNTSQWYLYFQQDCNTGAVEYAMANGEDQGRICKSKDVTDLFVKFSWNVNGNATFGKDFDIFEMNGLYSDIAAAIEANFTYTAQELRANGLKVNVANDTLVSDYDSAPITFGKQATFTTYYF